MRTALLLVALLGCCAHARADETVFASGFEPVWVLGYHVGYQSGVYANDNAYPTDKIDFAPLSHVVIGPVVPQTDGSLDYTFDIDATNESRTLRDLPQI